MLSSPQHLSYCLNAAPIKQRSERALALLDAVNDAHVAQCVLAYARLFSTNQTQCDHLSTNRMRRSLPPNDFGVEIVWRTHMLRPLLYRACCAKDGAWAADRGGEAKTLATDTHARLSEWAGLDLVAAVRRYVSAWTSFRVIPPPINTEMTQHRHTFTMHGHS